MYKVFLKLRISKLRISLTIETMVTRNTATKQTMQVLGEGNESFIWGHLPVLSWLYGPLRVVPEL